jgi:cell wall-associated NlpC family hydrolase
MKRGMRRPLAAFACLAFVCAGAAAAQPQAANRSWADQQIRFVVAHGLMAKSVAGFKPDAPLTRGALNQVVAALGRTPAGVPADPPSTTDPHQVTIAQLDSRLVAGLGLSPASRSFAQGARDAGLTVPSRFGTEVVARLIGLRFNHPDGQDDLELLPSQTATRAEAAFSVAAALQLSEDQRQLVLDEASAFQLPELTDWQIVVVDTAVKLIGYPYVWAGTSEEPQKPTGAQVPGGFDCSGFAWRVFKLQAYDDGGVLAKTLNGRTAAEMAGEVPASKRIAYAKLQPADLMFFASSGSKKAGAVDHMGIYIGDGWMIHSSRFGVALAPVTDGWYRTNFTWGRRPLAEAGLS